MLRPAVEQTSAAYSHLRKDRKTRLMSMSFACVSHSSDPLAAIAFSSWRVGGIVLLLVVFFVPDTKCFFVLDTKCFFCSGYKMFFLFRIQNVFFVPDTKCFFVLDTKCFFCSGYKMFFCSGEVFFFSFFFFFLPPFFLEFIDICQND